MMIWCVFSYSTGLSIEAHPISAWSVHGFFPPYIYGNIDITWCTCCSNFYALCTHVLLYTKSFFDIAILYVFIFSLMK